MEMEKMLVLIAIGLLILIAYITDTRSKPDKEFEYIPKMKAKVEIYYFMKENSFPQEAIEAVKNDKHWEFNPVLTPKESMFFMPFYSESQRKWIEEWQGYGYEYIPGEGLFLTQWCYTHEDIKLVDSFDLMDKNFKYPIPLEEMARLSRESEEAFYEWKAAQVKMERRDGGLE